MKQRLAEPSDKTRRRGRRQQLEEWAVVKVPDGATVVRPSKEGSDGKGRGTEAPVNCRASDRQDRRNEEESEASRARDGFAGNEEGSEVSSAREGVTERNDGYTNGAEGDARRAKRVRFAEEYGSPSDVSGLLQSRDGASADASEAVRRISGFMDSDRTGSKGARDGNVRAISAVSSEAERTSGAGRKPGLVEVPPSRVKPGGRDAVRDTLSVVLREMQRGNVKKGRACALRAREQVHWPSAEELRWQQKAARRREREQRRRIRREVKSALDAALEQVATVQGVTSEREEDTSPTENSLVEQSVIAEADVEMPEPSEDFRSALFWTERALQAHAHVESRVNELKDGYAKLAVAEAQRLELLAAGEVVGDNDVREGVTVQLVTAAAGLHLLGERDWVPVEDDTPVYVARVRRRYEKRLRKARAKEQRRWQERLRQQVVADGAFVRRDEESRRRHGGRPREITAAEAEAIGFALPHAINTLIKTGKKGKVRKQYQYCSGCTHTRPTSRWSDVAGRDVRVGRLRAVQAPALDALPTASVTVQGEARQVRLDTGAQYSVAGPAWAAYGQKLDVLPPVEYMEGFTGETAKVKGVWRFRFETQYLQSMVVDALIVDGPAEDFLLGEDWMLQHGVKLDFLTREMKWYVDGTKKIVPFTCHRQEDEEEPMAKVRLVRQAKVRTQTCHKVAVAVPDPEGSTGIFVPKEAGGTHVLLAPTVETVREGTIVVPVMNLIGKTAKLPSREALGTWQPVREDMDLIEMNGDLDRDKVLQWLESELQAKTEPLSNEEDLHLGDMDDADKDLLLRLLRNYPALLEARTGCPPLTKLGVEHHINTGTEEPIKIRARRHSPAEQEVIDKEVDKMLEDGVIEEGSGAWGFPVVLVRKKDDTIRFCVDYRLLNAKTVKDVYPLPRIDDTIESLHGAQRFTSLDLHSGYWQIPVAAQDKDKTGFVTRRGLFRFVRMPFGLSNAPGTFQRVMDAVLRGLIWQSCLVYLDDIIVYSRGGMGRHVVELAAVLQRLKVAGLSLKAKKCTFAARQLEYLGHELSEDGIRPMQSLVDSVARFPVPTDERGVKSFVHLAGFYRRFIANFKSKAAPLTKLLRKNVEWQWRAEQQKAFEALKTELTQRPLLAYPDFRRPFELVTDTSQVGLGAVLMQDHGRGLQPIAYASKVNSPTVAKYSITDLECAAVVWAVGLFRPYLYGRKFKLITDHAALSWLMKSKDLTGRLHRWALKLQEMDFEIQYRPGTTNVVADALSRAPVARTASVAVTAGGEPLVEEEHVAAPGDSGQLTDEEIRVQQRQDREVRRLKRAGRYGGSRIVQEDGIAYVLMDDGSRRVVLPASLWVKAFREAHGSIFACHLRVPQTYARIAATYWWPGMKSQVRQWVYGCRDCGSRKTKPKLVVPPLRSQGGGMPADRWALDVAGPLPVTGDGNRYVIAAVDYATRYAVAVAVPAPTAKDIAKFVAERVVLVYGPMRELVNDGAPELGGKVLDELAALLQMKQVTPVPYRPRLLGLVERFHKIWKDMVAMYVAEQQNDWDQWLPCAVYAYNGARHGTTGFSPNELMMGRRLRAPNELLRASGVTRVERWADYHRSLVRNMRSAQTIANRAITKDQRRRAKFHDKQVRHKANFRLGDLVWVLKPPRGKGVTKLAHQWVGPAKILEDAGHDNWLVKRLDTGAELVTHCSFVTKYHHPTGLLEQIARQTLHELGAEEQDAETETEVAAGGEYGERPPTENEVSEVDLRQPRQESEKVRSSGVTEGLPAQPSLAVRPDTSIDRVSEEEPELEAPRIGTPLGAQHEQDRRRVPAPVFKKPPPSKKRAHRAQHVVDGDESTAKKRKQEADAARGARAARRDALRDGMGTPAEAQASPAGGNGAPSGRASAEEGETDSAGREGRVAGDGVEHDAGDATPEVQEQEGAGMAQLATARTGHVRVVAGLERASGVQRDVPDARAGGGEEAPRGQAFIPTFLLAPEYGYVVERGRRRVRNRAGRYELQYWVEIGKRKDGPTSQYWVTAPQFERLFDDDKVEDDLDVRDGVWTGGRSLPQDPGNLPGSRELPRRQ